MYRTVMRSSLYAVLGSALVSSSLWSCNDSFFAEAYVTASTRPQLQAQTVTETDDLLLPAMHGRSCAMLSEQAVTCMAMFAGKALAVAKNLSSPRTGTERRLFVTGGCLETNLME